MLTMEYWAYPFVLIAVVAVIVKLTINYRKVHARHGNGDDEERIQTTAVPSNIYFVEQEFVLVDGSTHENLRPTAPPPYTHNYEAPPPYDPPPAYTQVAVR